LKVVVRHAGITIRHRRTAFRPKGLLTRTIAVTVPASTNLTTLAPAFTVFARGARVLVNGAEQISGRSGHDFTNPVAYQRVAPDGTPTSWKVVVTKG
jgi:hypothetical protein